MTKRNIIYNQPAAKFFYQGTNHSHPVRRTTLVVEDTSKYILGYEIREGNETRTLKTAPLKKYYKSNIARYRDYCRLRNLKKAQNKQNQSTLERFDLLELLNVGI